MTESKPQSGRGEDELARPEPQTQVLVPAAHVEQQ
jgi:hypothetical protein